MVAWGDGEFGGDSSSVDPALSSGVVDVLTTRDAFFAVKSSGELVGWGGTGASIGANASIVLDGCFPGRTTLPTLPKFTGCPEPVRTEASINDDDGQPPDDSKDALEKGSRLTAVWVMLFIACVLVALVLVQKKCVSEDAGYERSTTGTGLTAHMANPDDDEEQEVVVERLSSSSLQSTFGRTTSPPHSPTSALPPIRKDVFRLREEESYDSDGSDTVETPGSSRGAFRSFAGPGARTGTSVI